MNTTDGLEQLIEEAANTMWGPELATILQQALELTTSHGDQAGEYRVRLIMGNNAQMVGDTDTLLSNFAWCLAKHDLDPVTFPLEPDPGSDLMWQFKWMVGVLGADPQFSQDQIAAVLADMEEHYRRAGLGMSGVAMARFESAFNNGHLSEAAEAYQQLVAIDRDNYSHCDACVRSVAMDYHFSTGDAEKGFAELNEILDGGFTCGEEPEHAISQALVPLLRAGRLEGLASLHMRSYRDARSNADNIGIMANHVAFCAVTGNAARGLALAERHLDWLAHDPLSHRSHLNFLSALGLLLDKVVAAGHANLPVRGSDSSTLDAFFGTRSRVLTAQELAPLCWAAADALAADFDARNGNDWFARRVGQRRAMRQEHHELPLSGELFNTAAPRPAAQPQDTAGWVTLVLDLAALEKFDDAEAAYQRGLSSASGPLERAALHRAATTIGVVGSSDGSDAEETGRILAEREAMLQELLGLETAALNDAGDAVMASVVGKVAVKLAEPALWATEQSMLANLHEQLETVATGHPRTEAFLLGAMARIRLDHNDEHGALPALEELAAVIDRWEAGDAPSYAADLALAKADHALMMLHATGEDASMELLGERIESSLAVEVRPLRRASTLALRSRLRAGAGNFAQALADAEAATELLLVLGAREAVIQMIQLSAAILLDLGRTGEYRARMRFGIHQARMAESAVVGALAHALAQNLIEDGASEEAMELLSDVVSDTSIELGGHDLGELYDVLGDALSNEGELGGAVNAWGAAVEHFETSGDPVRAAQVRLGIASAYLGAGYSEQAAEHAGQAVIGLGHAVDSGKHDVDFHWLVASQMKLAEALTAAGSEDAGEAIEQAMELAVQADSDFQVAEIYLLRAVWLFRQGSVDAAVAQALQGSSKFEEIAGSGNKAVWALLQAAHMLDNAERWDDAVVIYRQVLDALSEDAQALEVVRHQLADCLESAGRTTEAVAVRAGTDTSRQ